jgi:PKD repeat protein
VAGQDVRFVDKSFTMGGKPIWRAVWTSTDGHTRARGYAANYTGPRETTVNFSGPGTFEVTLTVYDHGGHTDTKTKSITVRPAPAAAISLTQDGPSVSVQADARSPYGAIASYSWSWGDGTPNGTTASATHRYAAAGNYTLRLVVLDALGNPGRAQATVSLSDAAPEALIHLVDAVPLAGAPLLFRDASRVSAFSGAASQAWSVDGADAGTGGDLAHVFDAPGWHNVTLRVTDGAGRTGETTLAVRVLAAPVAAFTALLEERALAVDASNSADPDGGALSFSWDWGDSSPPGSGATARHEYAASGVYLVNLTVSDPDGLVAFSVQDVQVVGAGVTAAFDASPAIAKVGQTVRFVDASVDPDGPVTAWAWEFGDGATGSGVSAQHAYAQGGRYLVNLTVTGAKGDLARVSRTIVVEAPPASTPTRPAPGTTLTPATPGASTGVDPSTGVPPTQDAPVETAGGITPTPSSPAGGGKGAPGPGLLATLLALGMALVLLARRR